jgi:hypothetical protein
MFTWYWIADLCQKEGIPFVLPLHESDPGGKSEERQDRFKEDRSAVERRDDSHVVRLSREDEGNEGSHEAKESSDEEEGGTPRPYPPTVSTTSTPLSAP